MLKRWSDEWKDKKTMEMETFNGKRELNINEGETASSISQSRVSNKADKAAILASEAQKQFGGKVGGRKPEGGRNVQFADEPPSPGRGDGNDSDVKNEIKKLDKLLQGYEDEMGIGNDDINFRTLDDLAKSKSRMQRDDQQNQEDLEEAKQLAD